MDGRKRKGQVLSWVLMAIAVVVAIGGLIYDGLRDGEDPNLSGLYFAAAAAAMIGAMLSYQARRGADGERD